MDGVKFAVMYIFVVADRAQTGKDCFNMPCDNAQSGTCFTAGCERVRSQTVCQLSSTSVQYPTSNSNETECFPPRLVPGFVEFCRNIIANANGPSDLQVEVLSTSTATSPHDNHSEHEETISEMAPGELCYGSTMLISVAVGCSVGGCGLTLLTLCFFKYTWPCKLSNEDKHKSNTTTVNPWQQRVRVRDIQGSTSSAMLLQDGPSDVTHPGRSTPSPGPLTPNANRPTVPRKPIDPGQAFSDTIYKAASESSSRDYQSIRCDSDSPYVLNSECSSEYTSQRLAELRLELAAGNATRPAGETIADYSSLFLGQTRHPQCAASDYACLSDDVGEDKLRWSRNRPCQTTFHVNGLDFPSSCSEVNQTPGTSYGTLQTSSAIDIATDVYTPEHYPVLRGTLSQRACNNDFAKTTTEPHEYFILEPM